MVTQAYFYLSNLVRMKQEALARSRREICAARACKLLSLQSSARPEPTFQMKLQIQTKRSIILQRHINDSKNKTRVFFKINFKGHVIFNYFAFMIKNKTKTLFFHLANCTLLSFIHFESEKRENSKIMWPLHVVLIFQNVNV